MPTSKETPGYESKIRNGEDSGESGNVKYLSAKEFRELGFLQELNRQFLHPLGLAMEVIVEDNDTEHFGRVWDCREDPEGMIYSPEVIEKDKIDSVEAHKKAITKTRHKKLGFIIQPYTNGTNQEAEK